MSGVRLWLDDERPAPSGWIHVFTADQAIELLKTGTVGRLSLDHDLGESSTGYDVITWIEEAVAVRGFKPPVSMKVHSANPVGRMRMQAVIDSILRLSRDFVR